MLLTVRGSSVPARKWAENLADVLTRMLWSSSGQRWYRRTIHCWCNCQLGSSRFTDVVFVQKYLFEPYDNREQLFDVPFLNDSFLQGLFPYCQYRPSYGLPHDVPHYHGVLEVPLLQVYPCDCSWQERTYFFDSFSQNLCLSDEVGEGGGEVRREGGEGRGE